MAEQLSDYLEENLLNHCLRNTAYTSPTTVYLALYTTDPTDADTGTEVSGGSYARQAVTFSAPETQDGAMVCKNSTDIEFPVATASWGTITHVGVRDAETGGNLLWHGALTTSKTINSGDQFNIKANDLVVGLR